MCEKPDCDVEHGYCHCGCGDLAPISDRTNKTEGYVMGEPHRFIRGHNLGSGRDHVCWSGGRYTDPDGYVMVFRPNHPRARGGKYVAEHILIAESAVGGPLPEDAVVHHINSDKADNRPENLMVCQDQSYHILIHRRTRAYDACGHPDWLRCWVCGEWDRPENVADDSGSHCHRSCRAAHVREYRARKKAASA